MQFATLPITALPAWCKINNVSFHDISVQSLGSSGHGIVTDRSLSSEEEIFDLPALMMIPNELVLCRDFLDEHAKVDSHFRELLDIAGGRSLRHDVLLFLLMQITMNTSDQKHKFGVSNPWTEYLKLLPGYIPLPTMWTEDEAMMLRGTSLEGALEAKLASLEIEYEDVKEATYGIPWCQEIWWADEQFNLSDWILLDAWFRSRSLEHPFFGESLIPGLDMVNHSFEANASYQPCSNQCVNLLLRPGQKIGTSTEVTISYGDLKSEAEMLFNYGFVENGSSPLTRTLPLQLNPDYGADPLGKAKDAIFANAKLHRKIEISLTPDGVQWKSPFLYLVVSNEEDGLDFRVLEANDGSRSSLRMFWHDRDVTESIERFDDLIIENHEHPLREVLMVRATIRLEEQLRDQLHSLDTADEAIALLADAVDLDISKQEAAIAVREAERGVLEAAIYRIDQEKHALLNHERVKNFLESQNRVNTVQGQNGLDTEDFS